MTYKLSNIKKITSVNPPCKKTMYNSREDAQDMIRYIEENKGGRALHAYKCPVCGFWHLSSKASL